LVNLAGFVKRKQKMEQSEVETQEPAGSQHVSDKESEHQQTKEATGDVSSQEPKPGSGVKMSEESEARVNRFKLFEKVMQKSLEKFIELASFHRFSSVFRPLYKKNPQKMENIHKQFIEELKKAIQLEAKLNELDKLERAAKDRPNPAWRPSGIPEQDFCSFLMPYFQKQEAYMRVELKKIQAENAALAQKVQAGREGIAETERRISSTVDEWKASVAEFERLAASLSPADVFDV
ncbi:Polyamine-modulated factor 1, partial [Takifugu flavidus]